MRKSCKTNDATIVRRVSNTRTRFAIAPLLFLLTACRTPDPIGPDTDTDSDSDSGIDSDTDTVEPACGPNSPPSCEELIDGTCYGTEYPPPYSVSDAPLTDEHIEVNIKSSSTCGFLGFVTCVDGRFIGKMGVSEMGKVSGGVPVEYETEYLSARVFDADTRLEVAMGLLEPPWDEPVCERQWYGDRDAYPCFEELIDLLYERYAGCTHNADPCDYCGCRVNEVTDVQFPGCEVE